MEWQERQEALDKVVEKYLLRRLNLQTDDIQIIQWLGGLYEARRDYPAARKIYQSGLKTTQADHFKRLIQRIDRKR